MNSSSSAPSPTTIQSMFSLRGRGRVLVLSHGAGNIAANACLWNGMQTIAYVGPEFIDGRSGVARLALIVAETDVGQLVVGSPLRFCAP